MVKYSALNRFVSNNRDILGTNVLATVTGTNTKTGFNGAFKYHRFINTGNLVVEQGGLAEILLVGGGGGPGGSGGANGMSGGGGGVIYVKKATLQTGTYTITIGAGGATGGGAASNGGDTTITYGGSIAILGDQDDGGWWRMRARGGGGGAGPHGGSPVNSSWGGSGGGVASQSQTYYSGMCAFQFPFRPRIVNGGTGHANGTYNITFPGTQTNYSGLSNTVTATARFVCSGGAVTSAEITDPGDGYGDQYNVIGIYYFGTNPTAALNAASGGSGTDITYNYGLQGGSGNDGSSATNVRAAGGGALGDRGYPSSYHVTNAIEFNMCGFPEFFGGGGRFTSTDTGNTLRWQTMRESTTGRGPTGNSVVNGGAYYYGYPTSWVYGNATLNNVTRYTARYGFGGEAGAYSGSTGNEGICIIRYLA